MSDQKTPKQAAEDLVVATLEGMTATTAAMSAYFTKTIQALATDTEKLLASNGASQAEIGKATKVLTAEMLKMLEERVKATMPPK